nr:Chain P, DPAGT1 mutant antigen SIIVFNLL [Mus musculus]
SIIVFNLL